MVPWYMNPQKRGMGFNRRICLCDYEKSPKESFVKMSLRAYDKSKPFEEKFQLMLEAEFGGMNEFVCNCIPINGNKNT